MKYKNSLNVLLLIIGVIFVGCSNDNKVDSKTNNVIEKNNIVKKEKVLETLQDKLDLLLEHNGKICTHPSSGLHIEDVSWNKSYTTYTSDKQTHTYVSSSSSNSYTTSSYETGGDYDKLTGVEFYIKISNNTKSTKKTYLHISSGMTYYISGMWRVFNTQTTPINNTEEITVEPGQTTVKKYFRSKGEVTSKPTVELLSLSTDDDKVYANAKTLEDYHEYLQGGGCHYHLNEAKNKIRQLFDERTYKEALAHKKPEDRISALEKYLEVFTNSKAKKMLNHNKRIIVLLKMTNDYDSVVWELNNPLLSSFKTAMGEEYTSKSLVFYIDNYMQAAKKRYIEESYVKDKEIPLEPQKSSFGVKPTKQEYPSKPKLVKGEFEKAKDFLLRTEDVIAKWEKKKQEIDTAYERAIHEYKNLQNSLYQQAYTKWIKEKAKILKENEQARVEYEQKLNTMPQKEKYWLWQAVLQAIGSKPLQFEKLKYDPEKEVFEYMLSGGHINLKFEGEIAVPITDAKSFKEAIKGEHRRIIFGIEENKLNLNGFKLYLKNLGYMMQDYDYEITNKNKLAILLSPKEKAERKLAKERAERKLAKERAERKLAQERAERKLAKEFAERRLVEELREIGIYVSRKLMWQDNSYAISRKKSWKEAKEYCKKLPLGGYGDWYLPSNKKLKKLYLKKNKLLNVVPSIYLSSTSNSRKLALSVYFSDGRTGNVYKSGKYNFRCVRNR